MKRRMIILAGLATISLALVSAVTAQQTPAESPAGIFDQLHFRNLGPAVAGGRVTSVVGIPGNPRIYYIGAAGGGVWKTTDGGERWKPIFEHEGTASIGAIALTPSNPNLVWVGTGEANPRNDLIGGAGLYFSPDGGHNWWRMGFEHAGQIASVLVDPHNSNTVFVGVLGRVWAPNAERGVFKTIDGGRTWRKVLYVNDTTGVSDLVMAPNNSRVLYAGMWQVQRYPWMLDSGGPASGLYRSMDGGESWTKLTEGLPRGPIGRIGVAVAPSNPDHLYALMESKSGLLWQSLDMGDSWSPVSDNHAIDIRPFYFSHLFVAPNNEERVYFLSYQLLVSDDGGRTVRVLDPGVHPDHHALWIDPADPNRILQGNDGGVWLTRDGGENWRFLDGMPLGQEYMVGISDEIPYTLCAGLQDNNAWCGNEKSGWYIVATGDGQYVVPAPSDPNIIYADSQDGWISRLDLTHRALWSIRPYLAHIEEKSPADMKYRFNWTSPIAVSPTDANQVYLGANVLFRSNDGGKNWTVISPDLTRNDKAKQTLSGGSIDLDISGAETYDTITSVTLAPGDPSVIWVGSDDGLVHVTRDGGRTWKNVTENIPGVPPWARIYQIGVSLFDPGAAYVSLDAHELDDRHPYVYRTRDFGKTWRKIVYGLPDVPVEVVREDPNARGLLVLGNLTGLFYSTDDGDHWQKFPVAFPTVAVCDLNFARDEHDLAVATHGRGFFLLRDMRPIEQMTSPIGSSAFHLFSINDAMLLNPFPRGKQGIRSATYHLPPAPQGAIIDYYLCAAMDGPMKRPARPGADPTLSSQRKARARIGITDFAGHPVASLTGPAEAGVNRLVWNLRYDPPTPLKMVPPGDPAALYPVSENGPLV